MCPFLNDPPYGTIFEQGMKQLFDNISKLLSYKGGVHGPIKLRISFTFSKLTATGTGPRIVADVKKSSESIHIN